MRLYIIRHAWAEDRDDERFPDDDLRPLTSKGKKRFRRLARKLVDEGIAPRVVATSPLVRCRQTAEILASMLDDRPEVVELSALSPEGDIDGALTWLQDQSDGEYAWIGHAPNVSDMTAALIRMEPANIPFSKGAVAAIDWRGVPPELGQGRLVWFVGAGILGC